jgi:hypothetical protein
MNPHSLALVSCAKTLDAQGPWRLICRCGLETEPLGTIAEVECAAETHRAEVMGTTLRSE